MPTVELSESAYRVAVQRSADGGFATVDEYVADVILQDVELTRLELDRLFTPDRMAQIAEGQADVAAGRVLTSAEVQVNLARVRAEWVAPL